MPTAIGNLKVPRISMNCLSRASSLPRGLPIGAILRAPNRRSGRASWLRHVPGLVPPLRPQPDFHKCCAALKFESVRETRGKGFSRVKRIAWFKTHLTPPSFPWVEDPMASARQWVILYPYEPIINHRCSAALVRWRWVLLWRSGHRRRRAWACASDLPHRVGRGRISHQQKLTNIQARARATWLHFVRS